MKKFYIILALSAFSSLYAQDTIFLKEVTVNERYDEQYKHRIDSNKIKCYANTSLDNLLENEPSIYIKKYGINNLSLVSIRGTQAHQNLIIWNQMPINSSLSGQINLAQIFNSGIQSVFIHYGINSLQQISGGLGGIVNIQTHITDDEPSCTKIVWQYESLQNQLLSIGNTASLKKIKIRNSVRLSSYKNRFTYQNNAILPHSIALQQSPSTNLQFNNEWAFRIKKLDCNLSNQFASNNNDIPPLMTTLYKVKHTENLYSKSIQTVLNVKYSNFILFTSGFMYSLLDYNLNHSVNDISVTCFSSTSKEPVWYNSLKWTAIHDSTHSLNFILKHHYLQGNYNDKISYVHFNKNQQRYELTTIYEKYYKSTKSKTLISFLFANNKLFALPAYSLAYQASTQTEIGCNIGYNVRIPYLNELYFIPGGNATLKPEKALQGEIFFQQTLFNSVKLKILPHYSYYTDWILWQPTSFGYWESKNIRTIHIMGTDEIISYQHNFNLKITINHLLKHTMLFVSGKDNDYTIHHLPYIPMHNIVYSNHTTIKQLQIRNEVVYHSQRYPFIYNNNMPLQPYFIFNTSVFFAIRSFTFSIGIDNVFNQTYQNIIWRAMPGRIFRISVQFKTMKNEN